MSHVHPSGQFITTLAFTITNHNQKTAGVAKSIDTNSIVSFDGMASCCNMQRERRTGTECYCVGSVGLGEGNLEALWRVTGNCSPDPLV